MLMSRYLPALTALDPGIELIIQGPCRTSTCRLMFWKNSSFINQKCFMILFQVCTTRQAISIGPGLVRRRVQQQSAGNKTTSVA
jgi:hypothetical protein